MKRLLCLVALIAFALTAMGCPPYRHHRGPVPVPGAPAPHPGPTPAGPPVHPLY